MRPAPNSNTRRHLRETLARGRFFSIAPRQRADVESPPMLGDTNAIATIAVHDVEVAKKFYGGKLGLKLVSDAMGNATYKTGNTTLLVYKSDYAGTNKAT